MVDLDTRASFLNVEGSRRIGDRYKIEVELRSFMGASKEDLFYGLRKDSYLQVELARYI